MGTTAVTQITPVIIAQEAIGALVDSCPLIKAVTRDTSLEVSQAGLSVKIGKRGVLVANEKVSLEEVTNQAPALTASTVTLKHKEVTFTLEDITKTVAGVKTLDVGYMTDAMGALKEDMENSIALLFADTGLTLIGDGTTEFTEDLALAARKALTTLKAPQSDRYAALSPRQTNYALKLDRFTRADAYGMNGIIAKGALGMIQSFNAIESPFIPVTTGSGTAFEKGAFFHKYGIVLATRSLDTYAPAGSGVQIAVVEQDGIVFRVVMGYVKSKLATEITVDCLYGVNFLRKDLVLQLRTLNT